MCWCLFLLVALEVNSTIDSVVMYPDRVIVSRIANVYLEKETDIVFGNLPGVLDDQSVRVKAKGLTIGEVQITKGYAKEPHPKVKELETKLKTWEIKDRSLNDELAVLKEKEKFLSAIAGAASDIISKEIYTGKITPTSWEQGLNFMVDGLLNTKMKIAELERARLDLQEKIKALKQELNDIKTLVENRKAIVFDAHPKNPRSYTIELNYIVYGASWRTYYELRANPADKRIVVSYYGKISQKTGEDWEDAKVVLSTAKPAYGGTAPSPAPWYIYKYTLTQEKEVYRAPAAAPKEEALISLEAVAAAPQAPPVETGIAIWYPLPGRYTVKSGEAEKKILITDKSLNAAFSYFMIPRVDLRAYLTSETNNTTDYLFLAGDASTYVGDDFTGKSYFPMVAPDESTTISFGVDERVRVKRELKKSKITKGGLFKNIIRYELVYENSLKNFHNKEINCTIVDQVPVPHDPGIKVADIKLTPKPTEEDKDRGIYYWDVPVGANGEYKITVSFVVEAPPEIDIESQVY